MGTRAPRTLHRGAAGAGARRRWTTSRQARPFVAIATDVLAGYQLRDDDAIDATRALRSTLHGFVTLEAAGGFGLPVDVDRSFDRLVRGLITALSSWTNTSNNDDESRE